MDAVVVDAECDEADNGDEHESAAVNEYNFDHPDAFDFALLIKTLKRLKAGKRVEVPIYNFVSHRRENKTTSMYGKISSTLFWKKSISKIWTTHFSTSFRCQCAHI